MKFRPILLTAGLPIFLVSCGEKAVNEAESAPEEVAAVTEEKPESEPASPQPQFWSEVKLHEAVRSKNPGYSGNGQFQIDQNGQVQAIALDNCGVTDLSPFAGMNLQALYLLSCPVPDVTPLQGMPLVELYLENTAVKDLSPLEGMTSLRKLYLSGTMVSDLSPIEGLPIGELNLVNTKVSDLSALSGMPLGMLWLTDSPVEDIGPLEGTPLVSLTLHRTRVADLSPLANSNLQRLHVGEANVTDLTPLKGLRLTRLVFDPEKIEKGMEVLQEIPTLQELGTKFEDGANDLKPPPVFWQEWMKEKASVATPEIPASPAE